MVRCRLLSALDPGKQGLKPPDGATVVFTDPLSALDPGKQGLKHRARPRVAMQ